MFHHQNFENQRRLYKGKAEGKKKKQEERGPILCFASN